jgi:catechol 2,3-dioxygenase-like lactoylglutathione lyase family enzyme
MKMSVGVLDHYNVSTRKLHETVHFYENVLGFTNGPRPPFNFPGAWLYSSGHPVLHSTTSHRPRSSSVLIQVSSIMSLSAAAALGQRSGISPRRESRTT